MYKDLGISEEDWSSTPQSVKTALIALEHRARLLEIRFTAYEKKLAALEAKEAEIESLKSEVAALRERLGQNSTNSSRPPSSDPPWAKRTRSLRRPSGRRPGGQAGHLRETLRLSERPDRIVEHRPKECRGGSVL